MADFKWADVGHYYSESPIVLRGPDGTEYDRSVAIAFNRYYKCIPILRHRDDMTEAEARELYRAARGREFNGKNCLDYWREKEEIYWGILLTDIGEPKVWHWLISHGFDVFGLIESGQAIRKETKADSRSESHC